MGVKSRGVTGAGVTRGVWHAGVARAAHQGQAWQAQVARAGRVRGQFQRSSAPQIPGEGTLTALGVQGETG